MAAHCSHVRGPCVVIGFTQHAGEGMALGGAGETRRARFHAVRLLDVGGGHRHGHDFGTAEALASWIARLLGCPYGGVGESSADFAPADYIVPTDILIGDEAARLGIASEEDFFGGSAPYAFVGTKAITHGLVGPGAAAPAGWREEFAAGVSDSVLPGFSAFDAKDVRTAGRALLSKGPVRLKSVSSRGGQGQKVVASEGALDDAIARMGDEISKGLVIEQDLRHVRTYSVGQVRLGRMSLAYIGRQRLTRDEKGAEVYGGSDLRCVQGLFSALLDMELDLEERWAVKGAMAYDAAAHRCFPGLVASRRNYDVACGTTATGQDLCGVLEQSWRWGGATGAELAAFEFFLRAPSAKTVVTRTVERHGDHAPPERARILYRGVDENADLLTKYVVTEET